ncbi:hypothetical protein QZH41_001600 [Actinostola sp. cb2023]|nr:hypothetical protein QZH41_001600 [Actinostola sp. cb2023]
MTKHGGVGCYHSLGMEDGRIQDRWISASSYQVYYEPHQARLHLTSSYKGAGVWCASYSSNGQYILIDLGNTKKVSGIATQGMTGIFTPDAWVTSYTIRYSKYRYYAWRAMYQSFSGNWDCSSSQYNAFDNAITARYIMVMPSRWRQAICMRIELYGCDALV